MKWKTWCFLFVAFLSLLVFTFNADATVCSALSSYNGTYNDASTVIQSCINNAPNGGLVELPAGKYYLSQFVYIQKPLIFRTAGMNSSMPRCTYGHNHTCAELIVQASSVEGILTIDTYNSTFDHLVIDGNKNTNFTRTYVPVRWNCSNCNFTNNIIENSEIGASFGFPANSWTGLNGPLKNVNFSDNLIAFNGVHDVIMHWADGVTVHDCDNCTFKNNRFVDNTDVDLVFGGCRNCVIQNNTIKHTNTYRGSSFSAMIIHNWPNSSVSSGNYTGAVISNNAIDCGTNKRCGFGLYLGGDAWYDVDLFGGSVHDNTVINAQQCVNIDDAHDFTVYNNPASSCGSSTSTSICGVKATSSYNIGTSSYNLVLSGDTIGTSYTSVNWDTCIPNYNCINDCSASENNAVFVSQSVPAQMKAGERYTVSVTMRNAGSTSWSDAGNYHLGSQNSQDNNNWGVQRVELAAGEYVEPIDSDTKTFTFNVTAPATTGTYNFQWMMVQDYVEWFGEYTPNIAVNVVLPSIACIGDSMTWGYGVGTSENYCSRLNQTGRYTTYNYGVVGDTSYGVDARTNSIIGNGYNYSILLIGANQLTLNDVPAFHNSLNNITQKLKDDHENVVISTLTPCDTSDTRCINQTMVITRNQIIRNVSYTKQLCYADVFTNVFGGVHQNSMFIVESPVRNHPNAATHLLMSNAYDSAIQNCAPYNCTSHPSECAPLPKVACLGDSITYGYGLSSPSTECYCGVLSQNWEYGTLNYGIIGDTTNDILSRTSNVTGKDYDYTILLVGTNDMNTVANKSGVPIYTNLQTYYNNLMTITQNLRIDNQKVIISTVPPCNFSAQQCSVGNQTAVINRNKVIRRVSHEKQLCYSDIFTNVFNSDFSNALFNDGLHPNAVAQASMKTVYRNALINCTPYNCTAHPSECYNPATVIPNDAEFISQNVPITMAAGAKYTVSVTMKNRGINTWTEATQHRLGSQNPINNHIWNGGRVTLSQGETIAPNASKTFTFNVTAPTASGTYDFQWQMLQELVEWFGGYSPNIRVTVQQTTTTTSTTTTTPTTTTTTTPGVGTTTTTSPAGSCVMKGNNPPCTEVILGEIITAINQWTENTFNLGDIIKLINSWNSPTTNPPN